MKVELHLHTSRYSACCTNTPSELMGRLIETGYDAVFITEHDAVWSDREIATLREWFGGISIFPGVELSIDPAMSQHLLVLGTTDPAYLRMSGPAEVLTAARDAGHLTVLAHPFRWALDYDMLAEGLLPDALEHRTCNHEAGPAARSAAAAERLGLPLVNAGDTHALEFLDRFWIDTRRPVEAAGDIRSIVLDGAYDNRLAR